MLSGWSTLCSLSWTRSNGQEEKSSSHCSVPCDGRRPSHALATAHTCCLPRVFTTFVLILQTLQCCDPDNIQRDGEDWLGICRQSWHQAVHRTPICERHIQHLPFLPGGAHEGDYCFFLFILMNDFEVKSPYLLVLWGWRSLINRLVLTRD